MEIVPLGDCPDHATDAYGWTVPPDYSPSACFAFARDENGVEKPLIYSFKREAWLICERNSVAVELPFKDQQHVARLLSKNVRAFFTASAGVMSGRTPVIKRDDSDEDA